MIRLPIEVCSGNEGLGGELFLLQYSLLNTTYIKKDPLRKIRLKIVKNRFYVLQLQELIFTLRELRAIINIIACPRP